MHGRLRLRSFHEILTFIGRGIEEEPEGGYEWNRKAFSLLYQLFQMSVSTVQAPGPAITIAK